jgi:hypothetical protein
MPCTALQVIEYKDKYYKFISILAQGEIRGMNKIAEAVGVSREKLYQWAKKECFERDLADANRGLLAYHIQQIRNGNIAKAKQGEAQNIKLFWQKELGWSEKTEVKTEIVNADSIVSGVIEAMKKKGIGE